MRSPTYIHVIIYATMLIPQQIKDLGQQQNKIYLQKKTEN